MSRYQRFQIALLFLLPVLVYLIICIQYHDSYLAITASYIVFLVMLRFAAIEDFLRLPTLQRLWNTQSVRAIRLIFETTQCQILHTGDENQLLYIIIAQPRVILSNPHLYNVSKLKQAVEETGTLISSMRPRSPCRPLSATQHHPTTTLVGIS
jgi:hypothetical protein